LSSKQRKVDNTGVSKYSDLRYRTIEFSSGNGPSVHIDDNEIWNTKINTGDYTLFFKSSGSLKCV
jgi:hypothetical protein